VRPVCALAHILAGTPSILVRAAQRESGRDGQPRLGSGYHAELSISINRPSAWMFKLSVCLPLNQRPFAGRFAGYALSVLNAMFRWVIEQGCLLFHF
jgi:hypothetical protein